LNLNTSIQTYTGIPFDYSSTENLVTRSDVSHALSNICRYNGHCSKFYSVAAHSVLVHDIMVFDGHTEEDYLLYGLIHDVGEAYFVDLPRPLKELFKTDERFKDFQSIYDSLEYSVVEKMYGKPVDEKVKKAIKYYDNWALSIEAKYLMKDYGGEIFAGVRDFFSDLEEPYFAQDYIMTNRDPIFWKMKFETVLSKYKGV